MIEYVNGFLFRWTRDEEDSITEELLLIEKQKPEWQKGKLNGVGGKIEPGESPHEAMVREFEEEAGVTIPEWESFAVLIGKDYKIHFFRQIVLTNFHKPVSMTEEKVQWYNLDNLPENVVPNLTWLLPMAYNMDSDHYVTITNPIITAEEGQKINVN